MNIGMALSGGGYRATVFHLGVLEWFARAGYLGDVKFLSTVSGGSICIGLIFAVTGNKWPDNRQYREEVVPKIRDWLTTVDLQGALIRRAIISPFQTRADDLAKLMERHFEMAGTLQDIPSEPRWVINTTTYETGKLFGIEKQRMGDYLLQYVKNPDIKLSEAVAASAGFPVGIGPLKLKTSKYHWLTFNNNLLNKPVDPPKFEEIHLWDGGVYNNLGDEPLFDPGYGYKDVNFLVVSDASGLFDVQVEYSRGISPLKRLLDIAISQVNGMRRRMLLAHMKSNPKTGIFLQMDNSVPFIIERAHRDSALLTSPPANAFDRANDKAAVSDAAGMATHISDLEIAEFELLFRQGFEVANATYYGYINADKWLYFN